MPRKSPETPGSTSRNAPSPRAQVRFWGVRGTCAAPGPHTVRFGGNTPCVEVRSATGALVLLDAGTGIRAFGQHLQRKSTESVVDRHDVLDRGRSLQADSNGNSCEINLFLTHLHGDHVVGLPHFSPLLDGECKVLVRIGNDSTASVTEGGVTKESTLSALIHPPMFPCVEGLSQRLLERKWGDGESVGIGDLLVHRFSANHPGGASIFRVDDKSGPLVAYAPDNELDSSNREAAHSDWLRGLEAFLRGVPILIHDAMYRSDEIKTHRGWGHSSDREAVQLGMDCKVGTLVLFHHHPDRNDESIEMTVEQSRKYVTSKRSRMAVLAASEGLTLPL